MIPTQTSRYAYTLSSTSQVLPYPNKFFANGHLLVARIQEADGVTTVLPLVEGSDYSVLGAGVAEGGTVTMIPGGTNNVQIGDDIVISRNIPLTQITDFVNNGDTFGAETTENAVDRLTMVCQMLLDIITNSSYGVPAGFVERRITYCDISGDEVTSTFLVRDD